MSEKLIDIDRHGSAYLPDLLRLAAERTVQMVDEAIARASQAANKLDQLAGKQSENLKGKDRAISELQATVYYSSNPDKSTVLSCTT